MPWSPFPAGFEWWWGCFGLGGAPVAFGLVAGSTDDCEVVYVVLAAH